jgi:hypothetical protein
LSVFLGIAGIELGRAIAFESFDVGEGGGGRGESLEEGVEVGSDSGKAVAGSEEAGEGVSVVEGLNYSDDVALCIVGELRLLLLTMPLKLEG